MPDLLWEPSRCVLAWRMPRACLLVALMFALSAIGCGDVNEAISRTVESRRVASDLHVQFSRAAEASNRAVMADNDDASVAAVKDAEDAVRLVESNAASLRTTLQGLNYTDELRMLDEFDERFAAYRQADAQILTLAVQNTNIKAQQLSFGAAQTAADAFEAALHGVSAAGAGSERWHVDALTATAIAAVRQIQVLQAPHIADPDETAMNRMEQRMTAAEAQARASLKSLGLLVPAASRARVARASSALDQFVSVNANITSLSRQNTNVRSLALSLEQKRTLVKPCEDSLVALQSALAKRGYLSTRQPT